MRLNPVGLEAALIGHKYFADHNWEAEAVSVSDPHERLLLSKTLDVVNRYATVQMSLVISLPVLHKEANVLDVDTGARHLPETCVRGLAASTWLTLVARLLEELASQAGTQLPNLARLFPLLGQQRSTSPSNLLLSCAVLLAV